MKTLEQKFPSGSGLQYKLLDACYFQKDRDEKEAFDRGMEEIWNLLDQAPPLHTTQVQKVETESKQLKDKIEEKEKMLETIETQQ